MRRMITATVALCAAAAAQEQRAWFEIEELPVVDGCDVVDSHFGDVDGDGDVDVIALERCGDDANAIVVYGNDGAGRFVRARLSPFGDVALPLDGIDVADMDRDGDADLLAWHTDDALPTTTFALYRNVRGTKVERVEITGGDARTIRPFATFDEPHGRWLPGTSPPAFALPGATPGVLELHTAEAPFGSTRRELLEVTPADLRDRLLHADSTDWRDVDDDGDLDVVSSPMSWFGGSLRVLEARDGVLVDVTADAVPEPLLAFEGGDCAWGDFDGDGALDLVISNYGPPNDADPEVFLRQVAPWTFDWQRGARMTPSHGLTGLALALVGGPFAERQTTGVVVGDFDVDGDLDAVFDGSASSRGYIAENVVGLRFVCHEPFELIGQRGPLRVADIDHDDDPDLLAGDDVMRNVRTAPSRIGFVLAEEQAVGEKLAATDVDVGDLDGDGDLDVVLVQRRGDVAGGTPDLGTSSVVVLWNVADAAFFEDSVRSDHEPQPLLRAGGFRPLTDEAWYARGVDLADMDGDGDDDVLTWGVGDDRQTEELRLYRSDGRRATRVDLGDVPGRRSGWIDVPGTPPAFVVAGDEPDVIELCTPDGDSTRLRVPPEERWRFTDVTTCAWADYDGDGHLDVASNPEVWAQGCLRLFRGTADGRLVDVSTDVLPEAVMQLEGNGCAWVDLDADGDLDLVAANYGNPFEGGDPDVLLRNDDDGRFTWIEGALGDEPRRRQIAEVVVADFDLDGDPDLLFLGVVSTCSYVAQNLGEFRFRCFDLCSRVTEDRPWVSGWAIAAGDLDGDGDVDLVTRDRVYLNTARSR